MVGSGILTNSGPILKVTGSFPTLMFLWTAGGLLALTGALSMSELASGITAVGGDYAYVHAAFGPAWAFLYGWSMVLVGFAAPIAVVAYTTASFLYPSFHHQGCDFGLSAAAFPQVIATGLIIAFTLAHCYGHRESAWVQAATTLFKIVVLLGFTLFGLRGGGDWTHLTAGAFSSVLSGKLTALASGLVLVTYAYTGWNGAVYLAGETRDPSRLVPRCLTFGCLAVIAMYLLVNLFYTYALSVPEIRAMSESEISRMAEIAVAKMLGERTARTFSFLTSLGVFASLSAFILTGPRIVFAMAHDGLCPAVFGKVHPRFQTPVLATLVQGLFALIFLWSGTFEQILNFASYGLTLLSTLVIAPIFILRRRPSFQPKFRVPGYPWTPLFFLLASLAILVGAACDEPVTAVLSIASMLIGLPIYALFRSRSKAAAATAQAQ